MAQPLVCLYLFLDDRGGTLPPHPSPRTRSPLRYLECAVVQGASLLLRDAACEVAIATNVPLRGDGLSRRAKRLWQALAALGVSRREVDVEVAPGAGWDSCRLPWAAMRALDGEPPGRQVWLPNLDCVWIDPRRALAAAPAPGRFGCLSIDYPPAWRVGGAAAIGDSRAALTETARALGAGERGPVPWVGADLLAGEAATLRALLASCDELETRLRDRGRPGVEQLLTLSCALGHAHAEDLSPLARRIQTGPRHRAASASDPAALALWHLPAEKGLSLRRTASVLLRGGERRLRADLEDPRRAMRRFNVGRARRLRRLRDGLWLLAARRGG